jgi:hypothetical protein
MYPSTSHGYIRYHLFTALSTTIAAYLLPRLHPNPRSYSQRSRYDRSRQRGVFWPRQRASVSNSHGAACPTCLAPTTTLYRFMLTREPPHSFPFPLPPIIPPVIDPLGADEVADHPRLGPDHSRPSDGSPAGQRRRSRHKPGRPRHPGGEAQCQLRTAPEAPRLLKLLCSAHLPHAGSACRGR